MNDEFKQTGLRIPDWLEDALEKKFLPYELPIAKRASSFILWRLQLLGVYEESPLSPEMEALAHQRFRGVTLAEMQMIMIKYALTNEAGNLTTAAKKLGMSRAGLYRWIHDHNLTPFLKRLRNEDDAP